MLASVGNMTMKYEYLGAPRFLFISRSLCAFTWPLSPVLEVRPLPSGCGHVGGCLSRMWVWRADQSGDVESEVAAVTLLSAKGEHREC